MTHKSGVEGSTSRLARVSLTENSIIFCSCNVFQINICRRDSDTRLVVLVSKESIRATHIPATAIAQEVQSALWPQQRLDRTALVHCTVPFRHMIERQC